MSDIRFSDAENELLIELIKKNPPLFDPQIEKYKDTKYRDGIWKEIAEKLNRSEHDCRKRWKYIRDSFNRIRRKRRTTYNSSRSPLYSTWDIFGRLDFLESILKNKETSNVDSDSAVASTSSLPHWKIKSETSDNYLNETQSPSPSPSKPKKKSRKILRRRRNHDFSKIQNETSKQTHDEIDDDVTSFTNHVKSVLKRLNSRLKIQAKNEIFNLLIHYETMQLDSQEKISLSGEMSTSSNTSEIL